MPSFSPDRQKILVVILAGLGVSLTIASVSSSGNVQSNWVRPVADNAMVLPLVDPIVSSEPTPGAENLSATAGAEREQDRPIPLKSALSDLKAAKVAVSLSQAQLAQARINLIEFRAKHNSAKILSEQGKVSRQQADIAKAAHELAQLQHRSASIGLQESQAQLIAAKAEVSRLDRKANTQKPM